MGTALEVITLLDSATVSMLTSAIIATLYLLLDPL